MIAAHVALSRPNLALRPAGAADEPFERALFIALRDADFASVTMPVPLLATLLDQQFRAQRLGYARSFPDAEHLIVMQAGAPVGRVIVGLQNPAALPGSTLHLLDIGLVAPARGCGIGTDLITGLAAAGRALGALRMALSVFQTNAQARRLYERLGFVATADDGVSIAMVKALGACRGLSVLVTKERG